jgi:hypothetical protein
VCIDDAPYIDWRAVYTAFTRARDLVVIIGNSDAFDRMVMRKAPIRRSSMAFHLACALGDGVEELGVWPEPLVSEHDASRLWRRFEDLRNGAALPELPVLEEEELPAPVAVVAAPQASVSSSSSGNGRGLADLLLERAKKRRRTAQE